MKFLRVLVIVLLSAPFLHAEEAAPAAAEAPAEPSVDTAALPGMSATAAEPAVPQPVPADLPSETGLYEVRQGDTLWGLAGRFYKNPFDWKRIWDGNKQGVENPNLIYPDQRIRIPGKTIEAAEEEAPMESAEAPAEEAPAAEEPAAEEAPVVTPAAAPAAEESEESAAPAKKVKAIEKPLASGTMLVDKNWTGDGQIIGDMAKKILISQHDYVYINLGTANGLQPRMRAEVYRRGQRVRDPQSGDAVGLVVKRVGVLEITKDIQEETAVATVITSYEPLKIGDLIKVRK